MTVRNFQNYASEKYIEPAYRLAEEGIYRGRNPYWKPGFGQSKSLFNISTCADWRVDFLSSEAKSRSNPDGL